MDLPALKFVDELYKSDELEEMARVFRNTGYVVLPQVFERESVPLFRKELDELIYNNGISYTLPDDSPHYIYAALAPKARQILPHALSGSIAKPLPALHTTIIVIETDETRGKHAPEWHKDRQPDGMPGDEYHYPSDVFLAFYFEDIDDAHGPTQIIPGSHHDQTLTPAHTDKVESIHLKMEDALLIDQRAWHRGKVRQAPGTRYVLVYGAYGMPHHYSNTFHMPRAQMHQWMNATNTHDRVYFGGPFAPPTKETIDAFQEELANSKVLNHSTFPRMS